MFECLQVGSSPVTVGTRYRRAGRILGRRNIVHYRGIEEAITEKCTAMNFARTAYEPKREMGCHLVRLDHAVTHRNTFLHAILRRVMPAALNQAGQSPRTPDLAGH